GRRPRAALLLFGDEEARVLGRAVVGCRVKSGWATAVLVIGPAGSPCVVDRQVLALSDAAVPASRQPYHAVLGARQGDRSALERRLRGIVERVTRRSLTQLLARYRVQGRRVRGLALVVGRVVGRASIWNVTIRAHALEGQLFRSALARAAGKARLDCTTHVERGL